MKTKTSPKPMPVIQVDVVSDIICPWCWLGARYFQKAVLQNQTANTPQNTVNIKNNVNVTWRPYMLDANIPEDGTDYKAYMQKKFGDNPSPQFKAMREMLEKSAPELGINFRFDSMKIRPNTLKAHRLLKWAQSEGVGDVVSDALFKATFDTLENIGDPDVLARIGLAAGMNAAGLVKRLKSDEDCDSVLAEIQYFRGLGISGVPTFIYNGQFAVQGAQPVDIHIDALLKAQKMPALTD